MGEEEGFNVFKWMATYDKRWIYVLLFILVLIPLIRPIGMPVAVSARTKEYYDKVNALKEGDIVLDSWDMEYSGFMELKPGVLASHRILIEKGVKLCITLNHPEALAIPDEVFGPLKSVMERYDYTYGDDYIILGYVFPNEAAVAAMATDFHGAVSVDWKGESIEGTFLDAIEDGGDFAMISSYTTGIVSTAVVRHFGQTFGTPIVRNSIGIMISAQTAYLDAGLIDALLGSTRGGAELEYLIGAPGPGLKSMDAFTLGHYMLIAFIIIGNIGHYGWTKIAKYRERTAIR
jgi:hypothetical protein